MPEAVAHLPAGPLPAVPELAAFARVVHERFGLAQVVRDQASLSRRLGEAMAAAQWGGTAREFVAELARAPEESPLALAAAEAVTNQETSFFRDAASLRQLVERLVPELASSAARGAPLRILSAGCSTGEEAYSLTMLLLDQMHLLWGRALEVVGVDLSARALEQARSGTYRASATARAGEGPASWTSRFFRMEGGRLAARDLLRERTRFLRANLLDPSRLAPSGPFDLVVCRNVFIYFDPESIARALRRLAPLVRSGGAFALGAAEAGLAQPPAGWVRRAGAHFWLHREEAS